MDTVKAFDVRRGDVFLVSLDATVGEEVEKMRPCLAVSPDELNSHLRTHVVAPLTIGSHPYPFRIPCRFQGKQGFVVLDRIRTVDRERFVRHIGAITPTVLQRPLAVLQEMFSP